MKKNILIIDDDQKLNRLLTEYLTKFDYRVSTVTHPQEGLEMIDRDPPDMIVLDIMLPDMDGFETCKKIRKKYDIPIIMLTARGEVTDRIVGLELGSDDYLPKPFEPRELVARIQSVLRRSSENRKTKRVHFEDLIVDLDKQTVILKDKELELTTMEFELLALFIHNPGKVLTRDRIMENLRGFEWKAYDRSIDVLLSRLRQKLRDNPKNPRFIKTIWGSGYKFIGDENDS